MSEDVHVSSNPVNANPSNQEVDHLDGDPTNSDFSNLLTMERVDEDQQMAEAAELDELAAPAEPTAHQKFTQSLRAIADFYDAHPEITLPDLKDMTVFGADKEQLRLGARAFGMAEKRYVSSYFILEKDFGALRLNYWTSREAVCEKRQVGTKYVEAYTPPLVAAHEEPVYEWDCGSIFADDK